jgi:ketosteroid isomerase-like protein
LHPKACRPAEPALSDADRAQIEQEIRDAVAALWKGCSTVDVIECFRPYHDDAIMATDGYAKSVEEYRTAWIEANKPVERMVNLDPRTRATALSRTHAYSVFTSRFFVIDTLGVPSDTTAYALTNLWEKTNGGWKIITEHASNARR